VTLTFPSRVESIAAPVRKQVVKALRDAIMSGRLQAGQRLVEKDLCELLGVSRTSVREALRELEIEGFIESVPNRGPAVAGMTREMAVSIYQVRAALEAVTARLFATVATDAHIDRLARAVASIRTAYRHGNLETILVAKTEFYETLWEGSGNTIIATILRNMNARITQLRRVTLASPERLARSIDEIDEILEAITRRDPEAAFTASRVHVERAAETALASLPAPSNA
jgi:GntR family transcriptional regulator, trigonelline degradation regulator